LLLAFGSWRLACKSLDYGWIPLERFATVPHRQKMSLEFSKLIVSNFSPINPLTMKNFKDYLIWNQGIELAVQAYELTKQLPKEEIYGLSSQIKRAAVSIPSNIAEGCSREADKDFKRFLKISLGSAFELETDLIIAEKLSFIRSVDVNNFFLSLHSEQKQINSLISRLKGR
jgi:four helix bundle protein